MAALKAEGIEGLSLLGFLAAVGALRLLDEKYFGARLWFDRESCRARFDASQAERPDLIVEAVVEHWCAEEREKELALLSIKKLKKANEAQEPDESKMTSKPQDVDPDQLKDLAWDCRSNRSSIAYICSLMCDSPKQDDDKARVEATTLCALSGSGHQDLFVTLRDLRNLRADADSSVKAAPTKLVTEDHLRRALLGPWEFRDAVPEEAKWMGTRKPTLRWDESAERLHALRFADPTDTKKDAEPFTTELGAYALAANALAYLPVVPYHRGILAVSSDSPRSGAVDFYWPLWGDPLTVHATKMLLWSAEARHDAESAKRRGVFRWMRARRLTQEKGKLIFLPAVPIW